MKGNQIFCEMFQDGNGDPIELIFEVNDLKEITLKEIKPFTSDQIVYMEDYAEALIRDYLKEDGLKNLRNYGKRCWC